MSYAWNSTIRRVGCRAALLAAVGWLVPVAARVLSEAYYTNRPWLSIVNDAAGKLFAPGHNLFFIGAMNAVPFAQVAVLAEIAVALRPAWHRRIWTATIVLIALMICFTAFTAFAVWNPLFGPGRASSTAVIAFGIVPTMVTFAVLVLYVIAVGVVAFYPLLWARRPGTTPP